MTARRIAAWSIRRAVPASAVAADALPPPPASSTPRSTPTRARPCRRLHPAPHDQRDLLGSPNVVAWQEAKAAFLLAGDGAWSELPHLYARYGTPGTAS
jgi:hypothetical protein